MYYFYELLPGGYGGKNFLPDALLFDSFYKFPYDLEMHVGAEQSLADFREGFGDVAFADFADAAQIAQSLGQFFCQIFQHN